MLYVHVQGVTDTTPQRNPLYTRVHRSSSMAIRKFQCSLSRRVSHSHFGRVVSLFCRVSHSHFGRFFFNFLCVGVCVSVCVWICVCECVCAVGVCVNLCVWICLCECVCVYLCVSMCVFMCQYVRKCVYVCVIWVCAFVAQTCLGNTHYTKSPTALTYTL
jgi:hypothetical protein